MPRAKDADFRSELLTLIRTDSAIRDEVNRLILESAVMQELKAFREDVNKRFEAMDRRFEAMDRQFDSLHKDVRSTRDSVSALGSRWGIQTEEAVREFAAGFIAEEFGVKAEHWAHKDAELDLVIRNGRHCVIEVTSWCDEKAMRRFIQSAAEYEKQTGNRPSRRIVVTAHATGPAWRLAQREGIEVFSG